MTEQSVASALEAIAAGEQNRALDVTEELGRTADPLALALAAHLRRRSAHDVYASPDGFREFIDHGSNPALYDATIEALRAVHDRVSPSTVVDVGAGDGRVTSAVVDRAVREIHLIEPSADLIGQAVDRAGWPTPPVPHRTTLAGWVGSVAPDLRVDLVQSTFALHTIAPDERPRLLDALRRHSSVVAMVDFDVPDFEDRSAEHARYAADRYRRALDEYRGHPLAVEGFLMPVLVSQFDPGAERVTFEQSADRWRRAFVDVGLRVTTRRVFDHWWAPAFVLEATAA
jgi:trans-aconitate methyltransferase